MEAGTASDAEVYYLSQKLITTSAPHTLRTGNAHVTTPQTHGVTTVGKEAGIPSCLGLNVPLGPDTKQGHICNWHCYFY